LKESRTSKKISRENSNQKRVSTKHVQNAWLVSHNIRISFCCYLLSQTFFNLFSSSSSFSSLELIRDNSFSYCVVFCNYHDRFESVNHLDHFKITRTRNRTFASVFSDLKRSWKTWKISTRQAWSCSRERTESHTKLSKNSSSNTTSYQILTLTRSILHDRHRRRTFTKYRVIIWQIRKSTFNLKILKVFCEVFTNFTQNKRWRDKNLVYKIRADNSCFLTMLDKKSRNKKIRISQYHLINALKSRIAAFNVWFIDDFITSKMRNQHMKKTIKRHKRWKIKVTINYIKECEL
jgi:hypothetical protein